MSDRHDDFAFRTGQYLGARVGSRFHQPPPARPPRGNGRIRGVLLAIAIGVAVGAVLTGMNLA